MPSATETNEAIRVQIGRSQQGALMGQGDHNHDVFLRHLTQNERRVYAYILSQVPQWADADDILQETNLRLWSEFDKYVPGTDFAHWAMRVAHFQILTFRKHHIRDRHLFSDQFVDLVAEANVETSEEADDLHFAMADCIKRLSELNRELLLACYATGKKIKDVVADLGRSVPATYRSLSRIRITLHKCVEEALRKNKENAE